VLNYPVDVLELNKRNLKSKLQHGSCFILNVPKQNFQKYISTQCMSIYIIGF